MNNIQFDQEIYKRISPREMEVAKAASEGLSLKATADRMGISKATVQNYRAHIFGKLGCKNISEAIALLIKGGMI